MSISEWFRTIWDVFWLFNGGIAVFAMLVCFWRLMFWLVFELPENLHKSRNR